ncbi:hypothetical protein F4677DRAFT_134798 [Hypoxylon crocopeplum]|nr:hypothetical protein F4677DRAFT_134798 [Hypoxylon crocopeplum]
MLKPTLALLTLLLGTTSAFPFLFSTPLSHPSSLSPRGTCTPTPPTHASHDTDTGGAGLQLHNADSKTRSFFVYANNCDAIPLKFVTINAGQTQFVSLPAQFQGRVVRGTEAVNLDGKAHWLGTWLEIGLDVAPAPTGKGWADVSLIRGCDGAVSIAALDGTGAATGFSDARILDDAPAAVLQAKDSGAKVVQATEGLLSVVVASARDYLAGRLGYGKAYIDDYHGNPVICSVNKRFSATFYRGRH